MVSRWWSRDGQPLGTVSEIEAAGVDRFAQVHQVMSGDLLTIAPESSPTEIFDELTHRHLEVALVVENGKLLGVMTRKHALRSTLYRPALDPDGRLMIGAAVGINGDVAVRAEALLDAGIDVLVVDTAHGHQERMLESLKAVREVRDRLADTKDAESRWLPAMWSQPTESTTWWAPARTSSRSESVRAPCAPLG